LVKLENRGLSDVKNIGYRLFSLAKYADLDNPEQVSSCIANVRVKNSYKENLVKAYNYVKYNGLSRVRAFIA